MLWFMSDVMTTPNHAALAKAMKDAGLTQAGLAERIGTRQSLVQYWASNSKRGVPAEWVERVAKATGAKAYELRPDIWKAPPKRSEPVRASA